MRCPNCGVAINLYTEEHTFYENDGDFGDVAANVEVGFCPECKSPIIKLTYGILDDYGPSGEIELDHEEEVQIFPPSTASRQLSSHIPEPYLQTFREAEQILPISPKASATLSRYLLQMILHEKLAIRKRNLEEELNALENTPGVSSNLITVLQIMRKVANFGAHPKKSTHSTEIIDVEPKEADIMLDLLVEVFDFVFVKPAQKEEFIKAAKEKYGVEI